MADEELTDEEIADLANAPVALAYGCAPGNGFASTPADLPRFHYDHPYRALLRGRPDGMTLPAYIEALRAALADALDGT